LVSRPILRTNHASQCRPRIYPLDEGQ
jgi:hypothetical protein